TDPRGNALDSRSDQALRILFISGIEQTRCFQGAQTSLELIGVAKDKSVQVMILGLGGQLGVRWGDRKSQGRTELYRYGSRRVFHFREIDCDGEAASCPTFRGSDLKLHVQFPHSVFDG